MCHAFVFCRLQAVDLAAADLLRCEFAESFVDAHAHVPRSRPPEDPTRGPEQAAEEQQGAATGLRAMGLAAAHLACRERRRQSYPSVIV